MYTCTHARGNHSVQTRGGLDIWGSPEVLPPTPAETCSTTEDGAEPLLCPSGYECHILSPGDAAQGVPNRGQCVKQQQAGECPLPPGEEAPSLPWPCLPIPPFNPASQFLLSAPPPNSSSQPRLPVPPLSPASQFRLSAPPPSHTPATPPIPATPPTHTSQPNGFKPPSLSFLLREMAALWCSGVSTI